MIDLSTSHWEIHDIELVIFDKDGTLIDSHLYWGEIIKRRARYLQQKYPLNESHYETLCEKMGYSLTKKCLLPQGPIALLPREEVMEKVINYLQAINVKSAELEMATYFKEVHTDFLPHLTKYLTLLPNVEKTLKELRRYDVKICLLTSDTTLNAKEALTYLKLEKYFDFIAGKEYSKEPKKTGVPAKKICEKFKIPESEAITVGDANMDVEMAKNAKLKAAVAVASGQTPYEELKKGTEYVIKDLGELIIT